MKFAWLMPLGETWDDRKSYITTALESGINHIIEFSETENIKKLGDVSLVSDNDDSDIILIGMTNNPVYTEKLPDDLSQSIHIKNANSYKKSGKTVAAYIEISNKKYEELARELGKIVDYLILVGKDWTVIPLENIIADLQKENVEIIAAVSNYDEAKLALETLEHGTDGVLIQPKDFSEIKKIANLIETIESENYELVPATVCLVESVGLGDRVCIDTCSMMQSGEGMLIGSYAKGFFLVHSESLESEYVASRPFRVNAGPVQAYVRVPGNKTKYLSELETGNEVLIVNDDGEAKTAIVGRVKIEKRPLILIEVEYDGVKIRTLLQNAETIRLVNDKKEAVSVSDIQKGDKVLVYLDESARHFGMSIDETILEK